MSEEKPTELRDHIALEILNGIISHSTPGSGLKMTLQNFFQDSDPQLRKYAEKHLEETIRNCYRVADIVRRVRLSTFE